jgi:prepilin-type N-terminal cleavage/methylation domain-containing protein
MKTIPFNQSQMEGRARPQSRAVGTVAGVGALRLNAPCHSIKENGSDRGVYAASPSQGLRCRNISQACPVMVAKRPKGRDPFATNARRLTLRAFTLVEMLVVLAIIGILAAILLPAIAKSKPRAQRVACLANLHQIGTAFHIFAHEHDNTFPMGLTTNSGGVKELVPADRIFTEMPEAFLATRYELGSAKILACPSDTREPANDFSLLTREHVSYFVGLQSTFGNPASILAGDRNLVYSDTSLKWNESLHQFKGNLLLADAHVEERNSWRIAAAERAPRSATTTGFTPTASFPTAVGAKEEPSAPAKTPTSESPDRAGQNRLTAHSAHIASGQNASKAKNPGKTPASLAIAQSASTKASVTAEDDGVLPPGFRALRGLFLLGYSISALWLLIAVLLLLWKKIRERRALLAEAQEWHAARLGMQ